jgi:hypothetical protein
MKNNLLLFFILLSPLGCINIVDKTVDTVIETAEKKVDDNIVKELSQADKKDVEFLYKQYVGLSEYLKNSGSGLNTTADLQNVISEFQKSYEYSPKGFASITSFLSLQIGDKPKQIGTFTDDVTIDKNQLIDVLRTVANSAEKSLRG